MVLYKIELHSTTGLHRVSSRDTGNLRHISFRIRFQTLVGIARSTLVSGHSALTFVLQQVAFYLSLVGLTVCVPKSYICNVRS